MIKDLKKFKGNGIYVSHDAIIAAFTGFLINKKINFENWFNFLEGVYVWINKERNIFILWQDFIIDITVKCSSFLKGE